VTVIAAPGSNEPSAVFYALYSSPIGRWITARPSVAADTLTTADARTVTRR
jgi:hypothetical protein